MSSKEESDVIVLETADNSEHKNKNLLKLERYFTDGINSPFEKVEWTTTRIKITSHEDGKIIFDYNVEHPIFWDEMAVRICADKYFKTNDIECLAHGGERSIKDVLHRVAHSIATRGLKMGYFDKAGSGIIYDEICHILLHQIAAFNSPVFFNMGLWDSYKFPGNSKAERWGIKDRDGEVYKQEFEYENAQGSACYITEVNDELINGETGIYDWITTEMKIFANGSGSGVNVSRIRGEDEPISGGGKSSGLISFLEIADSSAGSVKSGGKNRRAAKMIMLDDTHPDLIDFINWKKQEEFKARTLILNGYESNFGFENRDNAYRTIQAQNANNSIRVSDEFMNAVIGDKDWELKYVKNKETKIKIKASKIFDEIVDSAWECGDPGLFYKGPVEKWNTTPNSGEIRSTNPCLTGETLIATADGRNTVSIKQLTEEGSDVPVYSYNTASNKIEIKMGRNPRLTGYNQKILKVTLDDGSTIRTTENHKFLLRDESEIEAKDLEPNMSLMPFSKYETYGRKKGRTKYQIINLNNGNKRAEHNLIYEFYSNSKIDHSEFCIHHKDYNGLNNCIKNLELMDHTSHRRLHMLDFDSNPMQDGWWNKASEEEKNNYKSKMSESTSGTKNGRYIEISNNEIFSHALILASNLSRMFTQIEWANYARENDLIIAFSDFRKSELTSIFHMSVKAAKQLNLPYCESDQPQIVNAFIVNFKHWTNALKSNYISIRHNGDYHPIVTKKCEHCNEEFEIEWNRREQSYCSLPCSNIALNNKRITAGHYKRLADKNKIINSEKQSNIREQQIIVFNDLKFKFKREPMKSEWVKECKTRKISSEIARISSPFRNYNVLKETASTFNHRVVSVEFDGYEDVYNMTVDDNHNLVCITSSSRNTKMQMIENKGLISIQCGEFLRLDGESCNLASLNLVKFLNKKDRSFNIEKFQRVVETFISAMEIIVGGSSYPEKYIAERTKDSRPLGLGYCNMGGLIMALGYQYDSDNARSIISSITSLESAVAYRQSAKISSVVGPFKLFEKNKKEMMNVIKMHLESTKEIKSKIKFSRDIKTYAEEVWEETYNSGLKHGFRNSQVVVIAPTGCVTADTLIMTSEGIMPISDLGNINGDQWQDINIKVIQEDDVTSSDRFYVNGMDRVYKIVTEKGHEIEATYKHKFRVIDENSRYMWKKAEDICFTDTICLGLGGHHKILGNKNYVLFNGEELTEEKAELLFEDYNDNEEFISCILMSRTSVVKKYIKNCLKYCSGNKITFKSVESAKKIQVLIESLGTICYRNDNIIIIDSSDVDVLFSDEIYEETYLYLVKVKSCDYVGEKLTYDISVPLEHTYRANGFISHNTIMFLMGTTNNGIEPAFALTMHKKMSDGSSVNLMCSEMILSLENLGYDENQINEISDYVTQNGHVEGAPHLDKKHIPVFDTANMNGTGTRYIRPMAHVEAISAATPFISGGVSKTINLPESAGREDLKECYIKGWQLGCKALSIYRDKSKWSQPLSSRISYNDSKKYSVEASRVKERIKNSGYDKDGINTFHRSLLERRKAPVRAESERIEFRLGGETVRYHIVKYPDGNISEVWLELGKEGETVKGLVSTMGRLLSVAIQYGVPIESLCDTMLGQQYQPSGFIGENDFEIRGAMSIADLTGKVLLAIGTENNDKTDVFLDKSMPELDIISPAEQARKSGYSGQQCKNCASYRTKGTTKCGLCVDCGHEYGTCSG
jgi:ribonucleotide reductase alpha subunit